MLKGDWRLYAALGVILALVSANVWGVTNYRSSYHRTHTDYAQKPEENASKGILNGCIAIGSGLRVGCVSPEDSTQRDATETEKKPSYTEGDSAVWGFGSMLADGWGATLTLVGVIFVILAFSQSRRDFIAANRPRVAISRIQKVTLKPGVSLTCEFVLTNYGESVAHPHELICEGRCRKGGEETKIGVVRMSKFDFSNIETGAQQTINMSCDFAPNFSAVVGNDRDFVVTGRFSYKDGNGVTRLTEFFRVYLPASSRFSRPHAEDEYADNDCEY